MKEIIKKIDPEAYDALIWEQKRIQKWIDLIPSEKLFSSWGIRNAWNSIYW